MATTEAQRMTLEEFRMLPEGPPYYEFEEGELIPVTSPSPEHQNVIIELGHALRRWVRDQQLGRVFVEVDAYLPDGRVYIPDFSFLSTDRMSLLDPGDRKIHGSPDLVVEITSGKPDRDRVRKIAVAAGRRAEDADCADLADMHNPAAGRGLAEFRGGRGAVRGLRESDRPR